jgi:hypothetical protein
LLTWRVRAWAVSRSVVHPPAARAGFALAVEVDGGDGLAEVVELGEVPGVEVLAPPGGVHRLPPELLEEHEHEAVDPHGRTRALIAHHLLPEGRTSCTGDICHKPAHTCRCAHMS